MVKLILTGLWVCVITLGAVYFSVQMATAPPVDEEAARKEALELVKGESITIPLITDGKVAGYFLSRISFMMEKEKIKGLDLPMTEYMTDALFSLLVGNKMVDITHMSSFNPEEFRLKVKEDINKRLGGEFVSEVLVEQLDYLAKDDTRAAEGESQTKPAVKIVQGAAPEDAAKAATEVSAEAPAAAAH